MPEVLDHCEYIRIRGLESSANEVFQGAIGGGDSDGDSASAPALDWGEIPEDAVTMLGQYTDDVNAWLKDMQSYDPTTDSRDITALAIPAIPLITSLVATGGASLPAVATVMVTQALVNTVGTAIQNYAQQFDKNSLEYIMRTALLYNDGLLNSEQSILKQAWLYQEGNTYVSFMQKAWLHKDGSVFTSLMEKAWLYQDGNTFLSILRTAWLYEDKDDPVVKSILKKALLYVKDVDGKDVLESVLHDMLKDLAFVDAVLDFGFMRVHIKGKMIEYA